MYEDVVGEVNSLKQEIKDLGGHLEFFFDNSGDYMFYDSPFGKNSYRGSYTSKKGVFIQYEYALYLSDDLVWIATDFLDKIKEQIKKESNQIKKESNQIMNIDEHRKSSKRFLNDLERLQEKVEEQEVIIEKLNGKKTDNRLISDIKDLLRRISNEEV